MMSRESRVPEVCWRDSAQSLQVVVEGDDSREVSLKDHRVRTRETSQEGRAARLMSVGSMLVVNAGRGHCVART